MKKKYRAIVVGCGNTSQRHCDALARLGIEIAAVVDAKPERAVRRAKSEQPAVRQMESRERRAAVRSTAL